MRSLHREKKSCYSERMRLLESFLHTTLYKLQVKHVLFQLYISTIFPSNRQCVSVVYTSEKALPEGVSYNIAKGLGVEICSIASGSSKTSNTSINFVVSFTTQYELLCDWTSSWHQSSCKLSHGGLCGSANFAKFPLPAAWCSSCELGGSFTLVCKMSVVKTFLCSLFIWYCGREKFIVVL